MSKRFKMPTTYVIIEKRDFQKLFKTVDIDGSSITGLNVKKDKKTKKDPRVSLRDGQQSKKRKKSSQEFTSSATVDQTDDCKQSGSEKNHVDDSDISESPSTPPNSPSGEFASSSDSEDI
jgi:hypothetical protein